MRILIGLMFLSPWLLLAKVEEFIPHDALLSIAIDDCSRLSKDLSRGPWGGMKDFPAWKKIKEWLRQDFEKKLSQNQREQFEDFEEGFLLPILESMNGGLAFGVGRIENLFEREIAPTGENASWEAERMPESILVFDSSMSLKQFEEIISFLSEMKRSGKLGRFCLEREKREGSQILWFLREESESLRDLDAEDTGFCLFWRKQKIFLLTGGTDFLDKTIRGPAKHSLAGNKDFQNCFENAGAGQARAFINFSEGFASLKRMMDEEKMRMPSNPFGIGAEGLIDGLGLDGLEHLGIQLDAAKSNFSMSSVLRLNHRKGLLALLSEVDQEVEFHEFIPSSVFSLSNARLDMAQIWPSIDSVLQSLSPGLHLLVNSQIQAFEDQTGTWIRRDLFGSLGDQWLTMTFLSEQPLSPSSAPYASTTVYALALKDADLFDRTLRAIFQAVGQGGELFEESELRGVTIRTLSGVESLGLFMAYAIVDEWLLISVGEPGHLNQLINRMKTKPKESLWGDTGVSDALDGFPSGLRQIDYVDLDNAFSYLFSILQTTEEEIEFGEDDFGAFPYVGIGWSKDLANGILSKWSLFPSSK